MAETPIGFNGYLGWVNVTDRGSIPPDARIFSAEDLIRYEKFGIDGAKRLNEHGIQIAERMTKTEADLLYASRTQMTAAIQTGLAEQVPPLVASSIAADETIIQTARDAVTLQIAELDILEGGSLTDSTLLFAVVDEDDRRTDIELGRDGHFTQRALKNLSDGIVPFITDQNVDTLVGGDLDAATGLMFAVVDQDDRRTDIELGLDGKFTPRVLNSLKDRLGVIGGGGGAGVATEARAWVYDPLASTKVVESKPAVSDAGPLTSADYWVNPSVRYQRMDGFGAALTESAAYNFWVNLSAERRREVLSELFNPDTGFTTVRISVASSDFQVSPTYYSYDDGPTAGDLSLAGFSIGTGTPGAADATKDFKYVVPVLKEIMAINPKVKVIASPWSPPAHIKTNGSMVGGYINATAANLEYYAKYIRMFIQAYRDQGIPIWAFTVQNETSVRTNYPSCTWTEAERLTFVRDYLRPNFLAWGVQVQIWDWDDNVHPLSTGTFQSALPFVNLSIEHQGVFDGVGWHGYGSSLIDDSARVRTAMARGYSQHMTEFRTMQVETQADVSKVMFKAIGLLGVIAGLQSITLWNMALDQNGEPTTANMTGRSGVITVPNTKTGVITRNEEYYMLRLLSAACHGTNSWRVEARNGIPTRTSNGIGAVGFSNSDGSTGVWLTRTGGAGSVRVVNRQTGKAVSVPVASDGITVVLFDAPTTYATAPMLSAN